MKQRIKPIVGFAFMLLAASLPLLCFGNMLYQNWNQELRYQSYTKALDPLLVSKTLDASLQYNERLGSDNQIVDPFAGEDYQVDYQVLEDGDGIYGYLSIPKISLMEPVYLGASATHLSQGLAHVAGTDLPIDGAGVRSVIAGHRGWANQVFFRHLDKLEAGDDLYFDNGKAILHYKMLPNPKVILPAEWEELESKSDQNLITLLTCDPIPLYNKRLLVDFERVGVYPKEQQESQQEIPRDIQLSFQKEGQQVVSVVGSSSWLYSGICLLSLFAFILIGHRFVKFLKRN
ncbi:MULTISPECIES: class C sortase [unclassified Streptococcus]|uniref:class C sortase n=1 Tax=unclassified Streptococcus TaxID=2608887 RepID=UPI00359EAFC2